MSGSQHLLLGAVPQVVSDPYFEYNTLLLPGNGTNGAQNNTFLDGSTNNFTITRNGNTTQGTFSPFSQTGWGNYFDGTGDDLVTPASANMNIGTGDFTVEAWIYPTSFASTRAIISFASVNVFYLNTSGIPYYGIRTVSDTAIGSTAVSLNIWSHIAFVRSGTTLTCYLNGTSVGSITTSSSIGNSTDTNSIGSHFGGNYWLGYISNIRVVKGTAVYTAAFTPPTAPLTAITNTSLLTCQSNRFIDNSTNAFAITANGDVSVQAFSPFNPTASWSAATNGGSGYFDGSGDYLVTPSNTAFAPGSGDWTFEGWFYATVKANRLVQFSDSNGNLTFNRDGVSNLGAYINGVDYSFGSTPTNSWVHFAISVTSGTCSGYLNGTRVFNFAGGSATSSARSFSIGAGTSGADPFTGYISNLRYVKGTGVYSGTTITVPTAPLTAITNTSLLLNYTNAGIYDATSKNDLETVGNAQISTAQSKFGGSSMYFDGTGDYLFRNGASDLFVINSDYTVECWVYFNSTSGTQILVSYGTLPWYLCIGDITAGKAQFTWSSSAPTNYHATGTTTLSTGTWYHIAGVRYGSNIYLYVNGIQEAVTAISGSPRSPSTNALAIGAMASGSSTANAYIQDVRITKGVARYTSTFTPPAAAFPVL